MSLNFDNGKDEWVLVKDYWPCLANIKLNLEGRWALADVAEVADVVLA